MLEWISKQSKQQKCDKKREVGKIMLNNFLIKLKKKVRKNIWELSNYVGMVFLVNLTKKIKNILELSNYVGMNFLAKQTTTKL